MKVKEEGEKVGLKLNTQKMKIMASVPITSCQIDGETMETVTDLIFFWLHIFPHAYLTCTAFGSPSASVLIWDFIYF